MARMSASKAQMCLHTHEAEEGPDDCVPDSNDIRVPLKTLVTRFSFGS